MSLLTIGQAARRSGLSVATLRYYEEIGLLPPLPRRDSGQRLFNPAALQRLEFVRRCRDLGFPIDEVKALALLLDQPERPCAEFKDRALRQLDAVRERMKQLRRLELGLIDLTVRCDGGCGDGSAGDCSVLGEFQAPASTSLGTMCASPSSSTKPDRRIKPSG